MARKTRIDQIADIDSEMEQLAAQKKKLLAEQKKADEKARTHRLCKRHGLFESLLPDAITLTEDNFKAFLQKTVANDYGRRTLAGLIASQERAAAEKAENATEPTVNSADAKTANAAQSDNSPGAETPTTTDETAL